MRRSKFTEEQIAMALRQAEAGTPVADICRKLEITEATFYRWKKKFGGLGVPELRELKQLREENREAQAARSGPESRQDDLAGVAQKENGEAGGAALVGGMGPGGVSGLRAAGLPGDRSRSLHDHRTALTAADGLHRSHCGAGCVSWLAHA